MIPLADPPRTQRARRAGWRPSKRRPGETHHDPIPRSSVVGRMSVRHHSLLGFLAQHLRRVESPRFDHVARLEQRRWRWVPGRTGRRGLWRRTNLCGWPVHAEHLRRRLRRQTGRQCSEPPASATGCGGGWTTRLPEDLATTDCQPARGDVNPGQAAYSAEPISDPPLGGPFDYNCDKKEELRYPEAAGSCSYKPPKNVPCNPNDIKCWCYRNANACFGICSGAEGWAATDTPECGSSASYRSCNTAPTLCNYAEPVIGCRLYCLGHDARCCDPKESSCNVDCIPGLRSCSLWCEPNTPGCAWVSVRCTSSSSERTQSCR